MIHYAIHVDGLLWDGRTDYPPAVGDIVIVDKERFVVRRREWETAEAFLGVAAAKAWGHCTVNHVCVTLFCEPEPAGQEGAK